jgi:hypothetical protein
MSGLQRNKARTIRHIDDASGREDGIIPIGFTHFVRLSSNHRDADLESVRSKNKNKAATSARWTRLVLGSVPARNGFLLGVEPKTREEDALMCLHQLKCDCALSLIRDRAHPHFSSGGRGRGERDDRR